MSFRREDLIRATPPDARDLARELRELNRPIERALTELAQRLYGQVSRPTVEQVALAVVDLPLGAVRRHLVAGTSLPPERRAQLQAAVEAVLAFPSSPRSG